MIKVKLNKQEDLIVARHYQHGKLTGFRVGVMKEGEYGPEGLDGVLTPEQIEAVQFMIATTVKLYFKQSDVEED